VETGIWTTAERILREYGETAEQECESRASYHEMQGDPAAMKNWRRIRDIIPRLRLGERPPG
jgi:hypothetical protein